MNKTNYENEALKLKSLLTVIATIDTDRAETLPEVVEVAKISQDIAENIYCAFANGNVKICE